MARLPASALANALLPELNAFRDTPVFYVMFSVAVLLESLCLRLWFFKAMHYGSVLWRVVLLHAASSLAGYLLMRSDFQPDFTRLWQQAIPFFFLTLAVEWPLVWLLFCKPRRSWKRTLLSGLTANVISYAALIALQPPVEAAWLDYLRAKDQEVLMRWTDTSLLAEATGRIYGTESQGGARHRLRYFSFADRRWHSLTNGPEIDPRVWDVEGDLVACKVYPANPPDVIHLVKLPDFALVQEIPIPRQRFASAGAWDFKLSPDLTTLAVLIRQYEIRQPMSGSSYQVLATTYLLTVFDVATGKPVGTAPRKASSGLCWLPDSQTVLFHSVRDERLLDSPVTQEGWDSPHAVSQANPAFADTPVYAYDVKAGTLRLFG